MGQTEIGYRDPDGSRHTFKVPDIWIAGYCFAHKASVKEAMFYLIDQDRMGREYDAQRTA